MIKKLYLPFLMALVVAFSSCSNKMGELSSDYFTVTPQVLEAVGGKVPATITGTFPEKYFKKNAVGQAATFQGEKVEGNDQTISYKLGGTYTMRTVFDYVPEMAKSELYLQFDAKVGSKTVNIPEVKVADGVISTSELINNTLASANPANGDDAFQRIVKDKYEENIMFLIQQYNIGSKELKNATAFNKEVANVNAADNKQITNVEISAYASPDGGYDLNNTLSDNRMKATSNVVNKNLKKSKIDAAVDTKYTAQDWEGFQELVSKSNLQDKEVILRVLSMYSDPEQRETEIKNMSNVYGDLASDILPQLRRSRLTLNYEIIGKSDEEIAALASSDPKSLNVEELLYAATLTDDAAKKEAIYAKVAELYPNDYRGFNNLGKLAYEAGNIDKAESYFKKAAAVSSTPEVNNNLGLVALAKGDKTAAEQYLSNASGSKELNEALGNLYTAQGQYDRAVNAFGDTATNSAALAQILAKDYNKANTTLSSITDKDAYTYYLSSVLGARTNNTSMLTENLKKAVSLDSTLAKKAATDLEFSKYFTNSAFTSIIK
jgi:Flp pilus assembly protein TadD